jgi:F0F1-type ATP synthase delta subunit
MNLEGLDKDHVWNCLLILQEFTEQKKAIESFKNLSMSNTIGRLNQLIQNVLKNGQYTEEQTKRYISHICQMTSTKDLLDFLKFEKEN